MPTRLKKYVKTDSGARKPDVMRTAAGQKVSITGVVKKAQQAVRKAAAQKATEQGQMQPAASVEMLPKQRPSLALGTKPGGGAQIAAQFSSGAKKAAKAIKQSKNAAGKLGKPVGPFAAGASGVSPAGKVANVPAGAPGTVLKKKKKFS